MKYHGAVKIQTINLNEVAAEFKAIQAQMERLEKELRPLRTLLEDAASISPDNVLDLPGYQVRLTPAQREVFSLKSAREHLPDQILRPFVRVSRYNALRVIDKKAA